MDEIAQWRTRIDKIDERIVKLLNERAQCALEIGRVKLKKDKEVYSPVREKDVINHICQVNDGPLDNDATQRIFEQIIEECKKIEKQ